MTGIIDQFGAKLSLAMKVLNISRGTLASEARADKSLVSRWARGMTAPRGHNLSVLTDIVRARVSSFSQLTWELPLQEFGRAITGGTSFPVIAERGDHEKFPAAPDGVSLPQLPKLDLMRGNSAEYGPSLVGHWRGWRATFAKPEDFACDAIWIRKDGDFLAVTWMQNPVRAEGWIFPGDGKAYIILSHRYADIPAFIVLYFADTIGRTIQFMDGMIHTVTALAGRGLVCAPYVIERYADALPNTDYNVRFFDAQVAQQAYMPRSGVPPSVYEKLQVKAREDGQLYFSGETSLTRGSTPEEREASAAVAAAFLAANESLASS